MKLRYQILILLFVALVLFVARDDVLSVYKKVLSYISSPSGIQKIENTIVLNSQKILTPAKSVNTPGALEVKTGLADNASEVNLSNKAVIDMTNKNRKDNGNLAPLAENSQLDFSAELKLKDMFKNQYFAHVSPSGVGVTDLAQKVSYKYIIIGENLALGNFKDAKALLDAWMASPGHRANILNQKYTEIGVAVGHGMYQGQDIWMAVQHFGLPRSSCPGIDESLQSQITLEENNAKNMEADLNTRKQRIDSGGVYDGKTTNEQINEYNALVATYNNLLLDIKNKISDYNLEVNTFNQCLSNSTSGQTT